MHTLIPSEVDFVPTQEQVRSFFEMLGELRAAPLKETLRLAAPSGKPRMAINPFTGREISLTHPKVTDLKSLAALKKGRWMVRSTG
jgi:hypothetical protein